MHPLSIRDCKIAAGQICMTLCTSKWLPSKFPFLRMRVREASSIFFLHQTLTCVAVSQLLQLQGRIVSHLKVLNYIDLQDSQSIAYQNFKGLLPWVKEPLVRYIRRTCLVTMLFFRSWLYVNQGLVTAVGQLKFMRTFNFNGSQIHSSLSYKRLYCLCLEIPNDPLFSQK